MEQQSSNDPLYLPCLAVINRVESRESERYKYTKMVFGGSTKNSRTFPTSSSDYSPTKYPRRFAGFGNIFWTFILADVNTNKSAWKVSNFTLSGNSDVATKTCYTLSIYISFS